MFPLEEIKKYKEEQIKNQMNMGRNKMGMINQFLEQQYFMNMKNNILNIYDCFNYNEKLEFLVGQNKIYCNNCRFQMPVNHQTKIYTIPDILILILNRGKGIEFLDKLEFFEDLNLMNYVEMHNTGFQFKLIGVVSHIRSSGFNRNFIAYCKSPIDSKWYKYNDDYVTPVVDFKEEIIDHSKPYILFYRKIDGIKKC